MTDAAQVNAFWALSGFTLLSALGVVISRNLFHSALFLVASFLGVAGIYLSLGADFMFSVQLLVYAGAIAVVIVFGVMLTAQVDGNNAENRQWWAALALAAVILAAMVSSIAPAVFPEDTRNAVAFPTTEVVALGIFQTYALPFEVASVLLLAAMVGAIVIAREDR